MRYRPIARQFFLIFVLVCIGLGWCGAQNPGRIIVPATFSATMNWIEGGQAVTQAVAAPSEGQFDEAAAAARAQLTQNGAAMVMIQRESAATATATGVSGGTPQTRTVTAASQDELEAQIQHVKDEVGARTGFFSVQRQIPFTFTVTRLSQILTLYYFMFFLVILPLLGLRETPGRVPDTIAKPVTA